MHEKRASGDMAEQLAEISRTHSSDGSRFVGVFVCGPSGLNTATVDAQLAADSIPSGPRFHLHQETFEL